MQSKLIPMTLGLMVLTAGAMALPPYVKVFETTYKVADGSKLHAAACTICHTKAPKLNPYGEDLKKQLVAAKTKTLTPELLKKIEKLDSDQDGATNIAEIKADTLPGDPTSKPAGKPNGKPKKK
jgi:mono/diheme cytochrome c family protein